MEEWKFEDPPNVAVLSDKSIFKRGDWIAYVVHEADDDDNFNDEGGSWQFHSSHTQDQDEREIMLVGLREVLLLFFVAQGGLQVETHQSGLSSTALPTRSGFVPRHGRGATALPAKG